VPAALVTLDWQAIATAFTGIVAVGAALWVGKNQLEIQKRQNLLIEREQKIQLLEKRTICVQAMRKIHFSWQANMWLPHEDWREFHNLMQDAELLFPRSIHGKLSSTVDDTFWSKRHYERAIEYHNQGQSELAAKRQEQSDEMEKRAMKAIPELLAELVEHTRIDAWDEAK
jgi:uncharacterized membrane protein